MCCRELNEGTGQNQLQMPETCADLKGVLHTEVHSSTLDTLCTDEHIYRVGLQVNMCSEPKLTESYFPTITGCNFLKAKQTPPVYTLI